MKVDARVRLTSLALIALMLLVAGTAMAGGRGEAQAQVLTVWHTYNTPEQQAIIDAAIEVFESRHPGITVEDTARNLDADKSASMVALNAGSGPDVVTANNGETSMGPMVRAGYLLNLDAYADQYGWEEDYLSPDLWSRAKYTTDGTDFGKGSLFGVPFSGELVGVYYNRDLFNELGIEVPSTMAEFDSAAAALKAAGYVPVAYGSAEMWPFYHLFGALLGSAMGEDMGNDAAQTLLQQLVIDNDPAASFDTEGMLLAARTISDWAENGYFFDNFTGIKIDDALQMFLARQAGMFIQGSWYSMSVGEAEFATGIFPFPAWSEGMSPQVGGMTTPLGINAASNNQDLAAEFINILLSEQSVHEKRTEIEFLPPNVPADLSSAQEGTLFHDLLSMWNEMNLNNRVGQYLDWATPGMGDALGKAGQDLLAGVITPEEFVEAVEAEYRGWVD